MSTTKYTKSGGRPGDSKYRSRFVTKLKKSLAYRSKAIKGSGIKDAGKNR